MSLVNSELESRYGPAAVKALERFPIDVESVELVSLSENVTFRVRARGSDTDYALRLHRPGYCSLEELESERRWVAALRRTGVSVQDSIATRRGDCYTLVDIPGSAEQRYAGMTTWQKGMPLRTFLDKCPEGPERARIFRRFGEIAATFHNQSTRWQAPAGFVRRRLGLDELLGDDPFWGRFWEHRDLTDTERRLLLRAKAKLRASLAAYGETADNFSLIHADLTPENIICDGDDLAVIDFDDAAYGWHLYDVASALIEVRFDGDFEALQTAYLSGYRQCRPLASRDTDRLNDFLLVRGMAIIGWFHQRPECNGTSSVEQLKSWLLEDFAHAER